MNDGTELEYRVELSIKHPKYDKKTVDNDVAMLRFVLSHLGQCYL